MSDNPVQLKKAHQVAVLAIVKAKRDVHEMLEVQMREYDESLEQLCAMYVQEYGLDSQKKWQFVSTYGNVYIAEVAGERKDQ